MIKSLSLYVSCQEGNRSPSASSSSDSLDGVSNMGRCGTVVVPPRKLSRVYDLLNVCFAEKVFHLVLVLQDVLALCLLACFPTGGSI